MIRNSEEWQDIFLTLQWCLQTFFPQNISETVKIVISSKNKTDNLWTLYNTINREWTWPHLCGNIMGGSVFQQHLCHFIMALLSRNVKRCVLVLGGGICSSPMLQKKHHIVHITQTGSDVQGCLLLLLTCSKKSCLEFTVLLLSNK